MTTEKLKEYFDAISDLEKAHSKVREYGVIVAEVARYLNNFPYKLIMANVNVPFTVTDERAFDLNANEWPSAKQIAEVLSDYVKKRVRAKEIYRSLSEMQRNQLKPHPEM